MPPKAKGDTKRDTPISNKREPNYLMIISVIVVVFAIGYLFTSESKHTNSTTPPIKSPKFLKLNNTIKIEKRKWSGPQDVTEVESQYMNV